MVSYEKLRKSNFAKRFWAKVEKTDGCWNWLACRSTSGYGKFSVSRSKWVEAHRISYLLAYDLIPEGMCVLHKCDNKLCVNPNHLFLGTLADNVHDCIAKGRARRGVLKPMYGEKHPNHKLSNSDIKFVKQMRKNGFKLREIAKQMDVSESGLSMILSGKRRKY